MKRLITVFSLMLLWLPSFAVAQHKLKQLWVTSGLLTPESVIYVADKKSPYLLVSMIDGESNIADSRGGIAKMSVDGAMLEQDWITGLNAPKGMAIVNNLLYVADIQEVVVIDINKRKIEKKIRIPDSLFLNDITISSANSIYVSDTRTGTVHRIQDDYPDVYVEGLTNVNGLKVLGSSLVVGAGTELVLIDAGKNKYPLAKGFAQNIDGIEMTQRGEFLVSCWPGLIYYVYSDGKIERLLDTQAQNINSADIGFDPVAQRLFVPNFSKNSVTAYQLN
jgi:hypothetical protein